MTSIIAKTLEHVLLERLSRQHVQSDLQMGFTPGRNPTMATLLFTETMADAQDSHTPLYVAALDAQKAFDVVDIVSLKCRLYLQNSLSDTFPVLQGVGQGRILSTHNYKLFIYPLLKLFSTLGFGYHIGTHFVGSPTCADDVLLMVNTLEDLQDMLHVAHAFACRERYIIQTHKSVTLSYNHAETYPFNLDGSVLPTPDCTTHLGIERYDDRPMHDAFIYARINLARRAAYSLMGVGFHGLNGLSPKVSRHIYIYMTFVIPRLLYGLEAIKKRFSLLEKSSTRRP